MKINELTKMSICIAIICISAYISFPLPFSPVMITAQTIAINLVALILTPKQSFIVILLYIILGAFGLPVFSGGTSGFGRIFGPTGGFILGFLIITPLMSYFKGKDYNFERYLSVTIIIGMIVLYAFGAVFMSVVQTISIVQALSLAVFPFVVGDIFKCVLSSFIAVKLNKVINK
ncbi:MAG: biotin transporter BioY [Clostridium sp.]|uniref:biotin transporter BioY n=1 Tax=Clostridium sp. TaxID=1506 RepID=UPI0029066AB0|nr:biotin transporter BioY [Clostridium sp.]MDU5110829.1 biotin transporter BioY [Clostridium sp.]